MILQDLQVGDLIVSKKGHSKWNLLQRFFAYSIAKVARKHYGDNVVFPDATHIRVVAYKSDNLILMAHATAPFATIECAKEWMLDSKYALVCRNKLHKVADDSWLKWFVEKYINSVYDVADLLRIATGWKWLDWGRNHKVCSTLIATMEYKLFGINPKGVGYDWVTPCYPLNDSERYEIVNLDRNLALNQTFKAEPCPLITE